MKIVPNEVKTDRYAFLQLTQQ